MKVTVSGDKELIRALRDLKNNKLKAAIRKGTRAGAKVVADAAKQLAPRRTGGLAQAIKVRSLPRSRKWTGTQASFAVQGGVYYGGFQEAGYKTRKGAKVEGKAFMRQAMQQTKATAADAMFEAIREVIRK